VSPVALALAILFAPASAPISSPLKPGDALPWFSGWTADDRVMNRTRLFEGRRRPVAIVLFATWCRPCEAELRALGAAKRRLGEAGLDVLLVDVGEQTAPAPAWLAERGLSEVPLIVDRFDQIGRALGAVAEAAADAGADGREETTLPRTVVAGADGVVLDVFGAEGGEPVSRLLRVLPARPPQKLP
jgi:peroxiredoxin